MPPSLLPRKRIDPIPTTISTNEWVRLQASRSRLVSSVAIVEVDGSRIRPGYLTGFPHPPGQSVRIGRRCVVYCQCS